MVVVVQKLSDSFLMSWHTQRVLGILLEGWPHKSFKIRKANVTICPKKLSLPSMMIGGGDGSYKPAPTKAKAITELSHPTTVTEVWSLLVLLNSFKNFIPDLTQLLPHIRSLLKKETEFQCTEQ